MNGKSLAIGSTLAAFLASLCCIGPLLLGGAGLGAALVAGFSPLRPYFLAVSGLLLAGGFYYGYRKPRPTDACAGEACPPQTRIGRLAKPLLWLATLAVAALAFFPSYGAKLARLSTPAVPVSSVRIQTAELNITGMDCEVCAATIQRKFLKTAGVLKAEVRYPAGSATVQFDPAQTDTAKLIAIVEGSGYKASPSNPAAK
jgi:mercuric ion transport protein